jgi:hypothetical protein
MGVLVRQTAAQKEDPGLGIYPFEPVHEMVDQRIGFILDMDAEAR